MKNRNNIEENAIKETRKEATKEATECMEKRYICHTYEQPDDIDIIEDYIEEA